MRREREIQIMRKEREIQTLQHSVQDLSDTLLNMVNTLNIVMANQNNINNRLGALEKLTARQQTLKAVRGIKESEDEILGAGGTG